MYDNLSNYFDAASRDVLKKGVEAWHRLKTDETWTHWLKVGEAIAAVQDIAAEVTGQSAGRNFNMFMKSAYSKPAYLAEFADMNKAVRSLTAKCWRNREAIEKWRAAIGRDKALRMNHPAVVWQNYEASTRMPVERAAGSASPFAKLKQEHAKALEKIHQLEKDGDISFTRRDTASDIADAIINALGDSRAEEVATAIRRKRGKKVKP